MKLRDLFIIAALSIGTAACSSNETEEANDDNANYTIEAEANNAVDCYSEQEIAKRDRNYKILVPYIKIAADSASYIFDISEEEAIKLGADKEYYLAVRESVKQTNEALAEAKERGDEIGPMIDFKNFPKE